MTSTHDLITVELLDDIDNLLFLCDRLSNRLLQVNSYVDEVKQTWTNKRRSIRVDSNTSPLIAQKASKYHKVLLSVAEKLAIVELQTESLHNLQSSVINISPTTNEKRDDCSSVSSFTAYPPSSATQLAHSQNEPINSRIVPQRTLSSASGRTSVDQRNALAFQNTSNMSSTTSTLNNSFTPRNSTASFTETVASKQLLSQEQSAFRRPLSEQDNNLYNPLRSASQNQLTPQRSLHNGYQEQSSILSRPSMLSDSYISGPMNDSNMMNGKIRVKMQFIKSCTIWHNADIPIIDHPSAFFVCNQDPRVAEQFNMMSIEMNNYYNKPTNTTVPLRNPAIGDFCVARFSEDQHWYRARVVLIHGNESILIVFIDYGNSETKPANEIYPLQESLARLPAMTVACTLAEAFPRNENFWTTEATEVFGLLVKNRIVEVHFQPSSSQQWPLHFVKVMLDGQSIAQHPKLTSYITPARNEQIAMHFNDKLTSMEYILYNVAVGESDVYNGALP